MSLLCLLAAVLGLLQLLAGLWHYCVGLGLCSTMYRPHNAEPRYPSSLSALTNSGLALAFLFNQDKSICCFEVHILRWHYVTDVIEAHLDIRMS